MTERTRKPAQKGGLVGLFGHTHAPDYKDPDARMIQYQFKIIRRVPPDRWLVQLFSWMDGRPTEVKVYAESFLLGDDVKLWLSEDEWRYAADRERDLRHGRREPPPEPIHRLS